MKYTTTEPSKYCPTSLRFGTVPTALQMRMLPRTGALALFVVLLSACATPQTKAPSVSIIDAEREAEAQRRLVVQRLVGDQTRLMGIAHRLLIAGADLCGQDVRPIYGFAALSSYSFDEELWPAARSFGIGDLPTISNVLPGSGAEAAGLQTSDVIKQIGTWKVPAGKASLEKATEKIDAHRASSLPLSMVVARAGSDVAIELNGEPACAYSIDIGTGNAVNAYADGERIVIEQGMMRFVESDEELGLVIGHELAHNAMGHMSSVRRNELLGGAVGLLLDVGLAVATAGIYADSSFTKAGMNVGAGSFSVEFEQEADYVGMYFLQRAGYDISDAPNFWRRMAVENPDSIEMRTSHPTTPERFMGLQGAIREIEGKAESGVSLLPEMKTKP
ncbi:MAG: M48 family metallopeptidase [Proteobacteria bacterium]|nr:M48 family metallopeptidase [Pseudomonadota bacterium]